MINLEHTKRRQWLRPFWKQKPATEATPTRLTFPTNTIEPEEIDNDPRGQEVHPRLPEILLFKPAPIPRIQTFPTVLTIPTRRDFPPEESAWEIRRWTLWRVNCVGTLRWRPLISRHSLRHSWDHVCNDSLSRFVDPCFWLQPKEVIQGRLTKSWPRSF